MTELETMQRARMYMEKLAMGINPIDDSTVPERDVINNVRLSRCFFYVADVLRQVIENGGVTAAKPGKKGKKQPFSLTTEQRERYELSNVPLTVTEFAKRISALGDTENMQKLATKASGNGLLTWDFCLKKSMRENALCIRQMPDCRTEYGKKKENVCQEVPIKWYDTALTPSS